MACLLYIIYVGFSLSCACNKAYQVSTLKIYQYSINRILNIGYSVQNMVGREIGMAIISVWPESLSSPSSILKGKNHTHYQFFKNWPQTFKTIFIAFFWTNVPKNFHFQGNQFLQFFFQYAASLYGKVNNSIIFLSRKKEFCHYLSTLTLYMKQN